MLESWIIVRKSQNDDGLFAGVNACGRFQDEELWVYGSSIKMKTMPRRLKMEEAYKTIISLQHKHICIIAKTHRLSSVAINHNTANKHF
jgi:hypothetical protein